MLYAVYNIILFIHFQTCRLCLDECALRLTNPMANPGLGHNWVQVHRAIQCSLTFVCTLAKVTHLRLIVTFSLWAPSTFFPFYLSDTPCTLIIFGCHIVLAAYTAQICFHFNSQNTNHHLYNMVFPFISNHPIQISWGTSLGFFFFYSFPNSLLCTIYLLFSPYIYS